MKNANMNSIEPTFNSPNVVGTSEKTPPTGLAQGANKVIIGSQKKLKVKKFNFKLTISLNILEFKALTARTKA